MRATLFSSLATSSLLASTALAASSSVQVSKKAGGRTQCTVHAHGKNISDVANIASAFQSCNNGGTVILPAGQDYYIDRKLTLDLNDVQVEWQGIFTFSDNLTYWRQPENTYPIAFQNHRASFIIKGDDIHIDGRGTGGIFGNGDTWYTAEAGKTQPGRPMPFVFWNVSDVTVSNFFVKDPPLWSLNIMNGTDMAFENITCNATATQAPYGKNWVQNTDGFDTMDVNNIQLTNFIYQGGDDCIAIKPRSYNVEVRNALCHGGNGMAVGSLGQYLEDSSVANILVDNVDIVRYNDDMENGAYIKTWTGVLTNQSSYESDYQPRGGGWGSVTNVQFSNFRLQGPSIAAAITEESGGNGSFPGSSKMLISNVAFVNFTGYVNNVNRTTEVSCSTVHPCYNIAFENYDVTVAENSTSTGTATCKYLAPGGVHGLNATGCT